MTEPQNQSDDDRLNKLKDTLNSIKKQDDHSTSQSNQRIQNTESAAVGLRAGAELIASIAAGAFLGYWVDQWLETKPLFLIILLLLGILTGFVNVWRTINGIGYQVGYKDVKNSKKTSKHDN